MSILANIISTFPRLRWVVFPLLAASLCASVKVSAVTRYVSPASSNPSPPFGSWATAAPDIQQAIDAASPGDEVVVTNGVYATGGRAVDGTMTNRVVVNKPLALRSVNGPQFTVIQGAKAPGGTNGDGAIRCIHLGAGASLSGFTLTNGATRLSRSDSESGGGGAWCAGINVALTNCLIVGNSAGQGGAILRGTLFGCLLTSNVAVLGGGAWASMLSDCTLTNNTASWIGGGADSCTLNNCTLGGNSAQYFGGGASASTLTNCVLQSNSAPEGGGGAAGSTLYGCTLTVNSSSAGGGGYGCMFYNCSLKRNSSGMGGGAFSGTLYNCTLTDNNGFVGGGAAFGVLHNCALTRNSGGYGGGANGCVLDNCTLTSNSASLSGGGVSGTTNYNCIVYFNQAPEGANYAAGAVFDHSCSAPLPPGSGNIESDPQLADSVHISSTSPCVGAGDPSYATGVDIDGQPWANPPAIGADQPLPGTTPLNLRMVAELTNAVVGYRVSFTISNTGPILESVWDFGDGTMLTNQPFAGHAWTSPGDYTVRLTGYNGSDPAGETTSLVVSVIQGVYYVNVASVNPAFPYASWETAATTIQEAIDAGALPGRQVLVTNGVYRTGAVATNGLNRVALTSGAIVKSVNGLQATVIEGETNGVRCAFVGIGSVLSGFTLTKGTAAGYGGGVWGSGTITNCLLIANSAEKGGGGASGGSLYDCVLTDNVTAGGWGGAAYASTLSNCILRRNSAPQGAGGGAAICTLTNCTFTRNAAKDGGGTYGGTLYNCTLIENVADCSGGGAFTGVLYNSVLTGNTARQGGAAAGDSNNYTRCKLYNCTLAGNSAYVEGGGAWSSTLHNCIDYFNRAPNGANYSLGSFEYSCTTPPAPGPGNISVNPHLLTVTHVAADSPCLGAGNPAYATGVDIDGEPWANPPALGADQPGLMTGPLNLQIDTVSTNAPSGYAVTFAAFNTGPIRMVVWDFGDGTMLTNQAIADHAWSVPGVYAVRLTGYNDSYPTGVVATIMVAVSQAIVYVDAANTHPVFPYQSWATAATTVQDAIGAVTLPGSLVLVTNGVYRSGRVEGTNGVSRVALTNAVVLQSVNGPSATVIEGETNGMRCAYVGNGSVLSGFTLTKGTATDGGAAWCEAFGVITNCALVGNSAQMGGGASGGILYDCRLATNSAGLGGGANASMLRHCVLEANQAGAGGAAALGTLYDCDLIANSANDGGGSYESTLYNCLLSGNAALSGGGASYGTLYNCTLTGNSADNGGGGTWGSTLFNSVVIANHAPRGSNYLFATFDHSCTSPSPANGIGNIDADPLFLNAAAGDFRLSPDSPCIDAGTNLTLLPTTDITGLARVLDGTALGVARVDMGAYEFNPYRFELPLQLTPTGVAFTIRGEPGKSVQLEESSDLANWQPAMTVSIPTSGQTNVTPSSTLQPTLFYRAVRMLTP